MVFRKYVVPLTIVAAFLFGIIAYRSWFYDPVGSAPFVRAAVPHVYKNPEKSISKIDAKIFYVVPKNKTAEIDRNWREKLDKAVTDAVKFHDLQFHGLSKIKYGIFPEPVILKNDSEFYDTATTNAGNPHALINIGEEIEARIFRRSGDLYDKNFSVFDSSMHKIMGFLYEGVGASGGLIYESDLKSPSEIARKIGVPESVIYIVHIDSADGFFMINRKYLADSALKASGSSIFYHELAHTIGLPDTFDSESGPSTADVMGTGRFKPIENTYIDSDFLKGMGIL